MWVDACSASAFAPSLPAILFEPKGWHGADRARGVRPRGLAPPKTNTTASTASIEEFLLEIGSEISAAVLNKARLAFEIAKRIQFLKVEAEIEGVPFSEASLVDFEKFLRNISPHARPYLFLNDNGDLRALWKNDQREQIALQFLGDGNIQFVIFKLRKGTLGMARVAGVDTYDKIMGHIKASGAVGLLFE